MDPIQIRSLESINTENNDFDMTSASISFTGGTSSMFSIFLVRRLYLFSPPIKVPIHTFPYLSSSSACTLFEVSELGSPGICLKYSNLPFSGFKMLIPPSSVPIHNLLSLVSIISLTALPLSPACPPSAYILLNPFRAKRYRTR